MKVIFLDIDGVLATRSSISAWYAGPRDRSSGGNRGQLDTVCTNLFLRLLELAGASVVISSSWRHDRRNDKIWKDLFGDLYLGKTGSESGGRGVEIRKWLDTHSDIDTTVILDDEDSDMGDMIKFVVKTDMINGFTDWQFSQCLQRLV